MAHDPLSLSSDAILFFFRGLFRPKIGGLPAPAYDKYHKAPNRWFGKGIGKMQPGRKSRLV
jgi:hypothetical protein